MKITTKTTRAEMAAHIAEQASLIDALKVTRDELRKERDDWKRQALDLGPPANFNRWFYASLGFVAGVAGAVWAGWV
jgi:uncharacterized membrane-anchored protein YhcB (DUF1043 family)